MYDIMAMEYMYGTSTSTNLGDTTYSYTDTPVMLTTILDVEEQIQSWPINQKKLGSIEFWRGSDFGIWDIQNKVFIIQSMELQMPLTAE